MDTKEKFAGVALICSIVAGCFGQGLLKDTFNRKPKDSMTFSLSATPKIGRAYNGGIEQVVISTSIIYSNNGTGNAKLERPVLIVNDAQFTNDCLLKSGHSDIIVPESQDNTEFTNTGILKGDSIGTSNYEFSIYDVEKDKRVPKFSHTCLFIRGENSKLDSKSMIVDLGKILISPDLPIKPGTNPSLTEWKYINNDAPFKLY